MSGVGRKNRKDNTVMPVVIYEGPPGQQNPLVAPPEPTADASASESVARKGSTPALGKEAVAEDAYLIF